MLSVFNSFLCDQLSRNFVNTYFSSWIQMLTGVHQGSLLSPSFFLDYTSDLTMEEKTADSNHAKSDQQIQNQRESKYADNMKFWRVHSNIYQLLIDIQIALMNLQDCSSKWYISVNSMKTKWRSMIKRTKLHLCRCQLPLMVTASK